MFDKGKAMKLLAIDQAYNHAGFAFFENDEYVEHGSYVVQKDADKNAKYGEFIDAIEGLIDELKPDCVITEMPWCGPNKKVYSLISELVGIIRCYCHLKDIEFEVVPIATYRSKLNIKNKKIEALKNFTSFFSF